MANDADISQKNTQPSPGRPPRKLPRLATLLPFGLLVLGLIAGFTSGIAYQKHHQTVANPNSSTPSSMQRFGGGNGSMGLRAIGTVSSVSSSSITVDDRRSGSETYNITSSTKILNDGQSASVSDIQTGDRVMITLGSSGSKDAAEINVNPSFSGMGPSSSNGMTPPDGAVSN